MKLRRHILFWLVYCIYFFIQSISPQNVNEFSSGKTYWSAFVSLCCFIPMCVMSVYTSIYLIFPRYIESKKYTKAIICFIALFAFGVAVNFYAATTYYTIVGFHAKGPLLLGYLNTIWAMIISGFAIGIKAIRKWYREQSEVHNILRDKTRNDLNLRKRKMHPAFLYSSLESIREKLQSGAGDASSRILTLSGLLSYSLYGTENEVIPLADEISAVEDFIQLEYIDRNKISIRIDPQVDVQRLLVPPMTIFSCLQESFLKIRNSDIEECLTEIVVKVMDEKVLIQVRFTGECADRDIVGPVFIRVPEVYAAISKTPAYDPA